MKRRFLAVITLLALVAALLAAAPARAASDTWSTHGPEGAWVSELVIDPQHQATVYAGTTSGVFKTTDGGGRWRRLSEFPGRDVRALAIAPSDPDVLYAAVVEPNVFPVYRSLDAGATWKRVITDADLDTGVVFSQARQRIVFDPSDPDTVYVATFDGGVLRSSDGGRHWHRAVSGFGASEFDTNVLNIAIDPLRPRTLLAATTTGLWRSRDGAATWFPVAKLPKFRDIAAIAFDPSDQRVAYAGGDKGLFRSTNAGNTWSRVGDLPVGPGFEVVEISIAPSDPDVIYLGDGNGHVYRSRDGAESWRLTDHDFGPTLNLPIAVHPSDPSTLYAGMERADGVSKSVDGARTWRTVNGGLTAPRMIWVVSDPSRPNVVYAGTLVGGGIEAIQKSEDGGNTWSDLGHLATAFDIDPSNPDVLYAGSLGSIYRSDDGGLHWTFLRTLRTGSVTPNQMTSLIVSTKNPNTIYAGVYRDGLFRSTDGGLHWTRRPIGFRDELIVATAMNPAHPRTLYVALARRGVYKTRDGGLTWREVLAVPSVASIEIDPSDPDRVYAGFQGAAVYATDDGGRSWNQAVDGLARRGDVTSIAVDPLRHATIYAGVYGRGVFESIDFGDHWHPFNAGLDDPRVSGLAFASDGATLHAATDGGGVFER
jgi:photosystem II stability/assembly factor-like uncharacterized protein